MDVFPRFGDGSADSDEVQVPRIRVIVHHLLAAGYDSAVVPSLGAGTQVHLVEDQSPEATSEAEIYLWNPQSAAEGLDAARPAN